MKRKTLLNLRKGLTFIFTWILSFAMYAQQGTISGTVTDSNGEALIGVSIRVLGTNTGTVTDANGYYTLKNVPSNARLETSYIGMATQVIDIEGRATVNIVMEESSMQLDEVVAIGYGVARKSDLTGAITSISRGDFQDQPLKNVSDLLQARTPGVMVTKTSGMPGSGIKVRIRGGGSINKSNEPLYVVDGIVGGSGIHPDNIESIEVLKDASSTAIYGSRGANGVVLITTKTGKKGVPQVTFETSLGVANMMKERQYKMLSAYDYARALNDIRGSSSVSPADLEEYKNGTKGIDWMDVMTRTGVNQDYRLSIQGGNRKTNYLVSANVLDMEAITVKSNYKSYNLRASIDSEVKPWMTFSLKVDGSKSKANNRGVDLMNAMNYSPTMEMMNEETGVYNKDPFNSLVNNPYGTLMLNENDTERAGVSTNAQLLFKILDGLTLSVQGAYSYTHTPTYTFNSSKVAPGARSSVGNTHSKGESWQNTNNLTYQTSFGSHNLTTTAVLEMSSAKSSGLTGTGEVLSNEIVGYWNIGNAATRNVSNSYSENSMVSVFGRVMYNYDRRYFVTGTLRADGSSKFQGQNRWGYFPSGSLAWDIARENFMLDNGIFDQLKLRTSYGITGNQDIAPFSTLGMLTAASYSWGRPTLLPGYWGNTFATPDVRWEKAYQYDFGLDASFFASKLSVTMDWFKKKTRDLLFRKKVPDYNGGGNYWVNEGAVDNTGFEFSISAYPLSKNSEFQWETNFNGTFLKNEIVNLAGQDYIIEDEGNTTFGSSLIMKPGYPRGSFYLYKWAGFDDEGANLYEKLDGTLTNHPTSDDRFIMGQSEPKLTLGWNNSFSYKNWSANVLLYAATGFERFNMTYYGISNIMATYRFITLEDAYFKNWDFVTDKSEAKFASFKNKNNISYGNASNWLENASFLKLKNITISYNIPKETAKIADIQLSLSGENVFILSGYTGMDPEVTVSTDGGKDQGAYPIPRTFTFGARITF
ncbi:MAG: SusC/RagA family TonB-linked outer membrane protein [Fermentimonas sp.]|jgi:TonB-linked SusC/RagA family outer membrane protein